MLQELNHFDGSSMASIYVSNTQDEIDDPYSSESQPQSPNRIYEDGVNEGLPSIYEDGCTSPRSIGSPDAYKFNDPQNESLVKWMDTTDSKAWPASDEEGIRFLTDSDGTVSLSGTSSATDAEMDALKDEWKVGCVQRTISNLAYLRWRFQAKMVDKPNIALAVTSLSAATAYLYVMMLRYPMLEPTVNQSHSHHGGEVFHRPIPHVNVNWKSFMVISFQIGYFLGKIPAVLFTSKLKPWSRLRVMIFVAIFAFLTTVAFFTVLPPMAEGVLLCLGAIALASLFGIISQYIEGRMYTEVMVSMVCVTLMLGRPLADMLARFMAEKDVSAENIPPIIGAMFLPVCMLSMFILDTVPPPNARDATSKAERRPISYGSMIRFVSEYSFGIVLVVFSYMVTCAFRNYREYFASDIYTRVLDRDLNSWHYLALEVPPALIVFICISLVARIKNNRLAFFTILGMVSFGAIFIISVTFLYQNNYITNDVVGGFIWIESIATGTYLMYIPTGFLLFDRLIACTEFAGTVAFLINFADVFGQLASLAVVLYHDLQPYVQDSAHYHQYYVDMVYPMMATVLILNLLIFFYFFVKLDPAPKPHQLAAMLNIQDGLRESPDQRRLLSGDEYRQEATSASNPKRLNVIARCDAKATGKRSSMRKSRIKDASRAHDADTVGVKVQRRRRKSASVSRPSSTGSNNSNNNNINNYNNNNINNANNADDGDDDNNNNYNNLNNNINFNNIDAREIESPDSTSLVTIGSLDDLWHQCPECHHRFTERTALRIHIRNAHLSVAVWHKEPFQVKAKIQALTQDSRNFTRKLPYNKQFPEFDAELFQRSAQVTMRQQASLRVMYENCVPSIVTDLVFWHNYAFRVKCIIEAFYSQSTGHKFWMDFKSQEEYSKYMRDTLTIPGTRVMAVEKVADVLPGDIGTFVSNDEPYNPPAQLRFDRLDAIRFMKWHQVEFLVEEED